MRRKGDPIWHQVHVEIPFPPPEGPWSQIVSTIKETANAIGVYLVEKDTDDIDVSRFHLNTRQVRGLAPPQTLPLQTPVGTSTSNRTVFVDADTLSTQAPDTQSSLPSPFTVSSEPEGLCEAGGKVCLWCCYEGAASIRYTPEAWPGSNKFGLQDEVQTASEINTDVPPILYRWANVDSQGVNTRSLIISGLFSNSDQDFFAPDEIPQEEFEQYATQHVSYEKSLSPFISTFQSLLAPLHRAIRAGEGAAVTFINTSKIETKVYSAKSLVWDLGIKIKGYRGLGEYLVWGKIPTPAIICTFKISSLVSIAEEDAGIGEILQLNRIKSSKRNRNELQTALSKGPGRMDGSSGVIVGRLLRKLDVPSPYLEAIAIKISYSWRFARCKDNSDYLSGVQAGYHGHGSSLSPSPVFEQPLLGMPSSPHPHTQKEEPSASPRKKI